MTHPSLAQLRHELPVGAEVLVVDRGLYGYVRRVVRCSCGCPETAYEVLLHDGRTAAVPGCQCQRVVET